MATVTNKWKVLRVEGEVKKVIRQSENGKKKAYWCWEFGLVNYTIQTETEPKLLARLNRTDRGYSDFESLNEVT
jgi:hypothetical protein